MSKTYVVDETRETLRKLLERAGYRVEKPEAGEESLLHVRDRSPESVFTYRTMLDAAFDMIFAHEIYPSGDYGPFTEVNEQACRCMGYSRKELLGMKPQDLIDPEILHLEVGNSATLAKTRQASFQRVLLSKSGEKIPVEINTRVLKLEGHDFALSIVRDIRERVSVETDLRQNERNYRSLFENMKSAFALHEIVQDDEGRPLDYIYLEVNSAFEEMTDLMRDKIIGRGLREVLAAAPEELDRWIQRFGEVAISGESARFEDYSPALGRWYSIFAYCPREGQFAVVFDDISRQKKVEKQLLEYGERLNMALEGSLAGLWDWDLVSGNTYYSPAWKAILGDQDLSPSYETWESRVHPEDLPPVLNSIKEHLEGRTENWGHEHRLRTKSGEWKWIHSRGHVVARDEAGKALRMIGTSTDITERKRAEELLQEQKALLDSIYNDSEAMTFVVDREEDGEFRYRSFSKALERVTGTREMDWVGRSPQEMADLVTPEGSRHFLRQYSLCAETGQVQTYEEFVQTGDRPSWWHTTLSPVKDETGRVHRIIGTAIDISTRKASEEGLSQERERAETYLQLVGVIVVALGEEGEVTLVNDKGCEILGYPREEILGKNWFENFLPISDTTRVMSVFRQLMAGNIEMAEFLENSVQTREGEIRAIAWHNTLIRNGEGRIVGSLSAGEDVTERRAAETELARSESRYRYAFESAPVSIWEQDYSEFKVELQRIRALGIEDYDQYLRDNPDLIPRMAGMFKTTNVNDETVRIFEAEGREQLLGSIHKILTPEAMAGMRDEILAFLLGARTYKAETTFVTLRGRQLRIAFRIDLPSDPESNQVLVNLVDITQQKKAEERLRESEEKYRRLTESAPAAITRIRLAETPYFEFMSAASTSLVGYSPEEFYEQPELAITMLHPEDRHHLMSAMTGVLENHVATVRMIHKEGRQIWAEVRLRLVEEEEGCPPVLEAYMVDITEKKAVQEELNRAFEEIRLLKERLEAENLTLREELSMSHLHGEMVGESEALKRILLQAENVAETDSTVLILGQTGTGKELLARAIHSMSGRSHRPLIMVNCAAMPAALIENELFGSEKGAFTGSHSRKIGRFEAADGGTLVLDEVGDLPLDLQSKLLRVLQGGKFERLGSTKSIEVDVRLIASTNADLERKIQEGLFRQDLFYRLNVFPITLPPLSERPGDIRLLVEAFVAEFASKMGKPIEQITERSLRALEEYSWPGNVRELRNTIERAMIECRGPVLNIPVRPSAASLEVDPETSRRLIDVEKGHILAVLRDTQWKVRGPGGAAEMLDMNPSTLESRMRKLGIKRPS